jgi:hypothetical protein
MAAHLRRHGWLPDHKRSYRDPVKRLRKAAMAAVDKLTAARRDAGLHLPYGPAAVAAGFPAAGTRRHPHTRDGYDRDEFPMAMGRGKRKGLERGRDPRGWKAHVEYVPSSENRSAGSVVGLKRRRFCDGTRFRYVLSSLRGRCVAPGPVDGTKSFRARHLPASRALAAVRKRTRAVPALRARAEHPAPLRVA